MTGAVQFPQAVVVGRDGRWVEEAVRNGSVAIPIELEGVRNAQALWERIAAAVELPHPIGGPDGMTDWLADLEWLDSEGAAGFLLVFELAGVPMDVVLALAAILPGTTDRWRSGQRPFSAILCDVSDVPAVLGALEDANAFLDRAGALPGVNDTRRVPVVVAEARAT